MLTEGKSGRVSTYRVYYRENNETNDVYIQALSAQQAADFIRGDISTQFSKIEIIEVAKVVNNWK